MASVLSLFLFYSMIICVCVGHGMEKIDQNFLYVQSFNLQKFCYTAVNRLNVQLFSNITSNQRYFRTFITEWSIDGLKDDDIVLLPGQRVLEVKLDYIINPKLRNKLDNDKIYVRILRSPCFGKISTLITPIAMPHEVFLCIQCHDNFEEDKSYRSKRFSDLSRVARRVKNAII